MSYYVRKIVRSKWDASERLKNEDGINKLNADFLSSCLKTQQGEISLWKINDLDEIYKVAIAICSERDYVDKIDLILIEDTVFDSNDIFPYNVPEGNTAFKNMHYAIDCINYKFVGKIANIIFNTLQQNENNCKRFCPSEVKQFLLNALKNGEINAPLKESLMTDLNK